MLQLLVQLTVKGVRDFRLNPWAQSMTFAAVTLIAFLGGLFLLMLHNLDAELLRARGDVLFQVYWQPGADMAQVRRQWDEFAVLPGLRDVKTFTPEQAAADLAKHVGKGVDLGFLKDRNPLPATALLSFVSPGADAPRFLEETQARLQALPGVATVRQNPLRTELTRAWSRLSGQVIMPLIGFLLVVLGLVVGNTIKLSMLQRQDEIEIMRIVGAREWYIRLPLMAGAVAQGVAGGLLAILLLKILQAGLRDVFNFPPLLFQISFLPLGQVLLLLAVLAGVGLLGSWLAIRRAAT